MKKAIMNIPTPTPWKSGTTFHMVMGPSLPNWPKLSSKKNNGRPVTSNMMAYGMRNAPAGEDFISKYSVLKEERIYLCINFKVSES